MTNEEFKKAYEAGETGGVSVHLTSKLISETQILSRLEKRPLHLLVEEALELLIDKRCSENTSLRSSISAIRELLK